MAPPRTAWLRGLLTLATVVAVAATGSSTAAGAGSSTTAGNDTCALTFAHQVAGPPGGCTDAQRAAWLAKMTRCRAQHLKAIGYAGGVFEAPRVAWTQQAFTVPMVASFDRELYDDSREYAPGEYGWTVDKFLAGVTARYGGVDAVLLWPTYENLGLDDRSQVALYRALPGGFSGMTNLTDQLHARGVRVLWAFNPWDTGTKDSRGLNSGGPNHAKKLMQFVELLQTTHADGINGDTMTFVPQDWWNTSTAMNWPLALEPEGNGNFQALNWETMSVCHCSWGQTVQTVDHYKWLDSRFQTSVRDRWSHDHTDPLQFCLFNGVGFETTENDWGTWNQFTERDSAAMKPIFTLLRFFGKRKLLTAPGWVPHVGGVQQRLVFGSLFPRDGESLYTLVNRGPNSTSGAQLQLPKEALAVDTIVYDCWRGVKLTPSAAGMLSFAMPVQGYGCVFVTTKSKASASLSAFLQKMQAFAQQGPLNTFSKEFVFLQQQMLPYKRSARAPAAAKAAGMVAIPAATFDFDVTAKIDQGSDSQFYWENPQVTAADVNAPAANSFKEHHARLPIEGFLMDTHLVTNADYSKYLSESQYQPVDPYNWLSTWAGARRPPTALAKKPVTHVGYKEAELFCQHLGKRLPHDWEFQRAGQNQTSQPWPWGSKNCTSCFPKQVISSQVPPHPDVGAFSPQGDSPFGVADMVGSVWQYTTSFVDGHNRNVLTRGSSNYKPICLLPQRVPAAQTGHGAICPVNGSAGSHWYYPDAYALNQHEKMKMMSNSYERAGTLGFRCVKDVATKPCTGKVCGRWSGPPMAFTRLSNADKSQFARWYFADGKVQAATKGSAGSIGLLRPLCAGTAAATTAGVSFPNVTRNGGAVPVSATGAVGSPCGFSLAVTCDGKGPQTLALFGGASKPLSVTATDHNGVTATIVQSLVLATTLQKEGLVDSHVHVTFDGAAGQKLTVTWSAKSSAPTPTPAPAPSPSKLNYTTLENTACKPPGSSGGQKGASGELGSTIEKSDSACTAQCAKDDQCSCAVFTGPNGAVPGQCERLTQCLPSKCQHQPATFNHTTIFKNYQLHKGLNCYRGHGAREIDSKPVPNLSQEECAELCEGTASCSGAVHALRGPKKGDCWRRADVVLGKCLHVAFQSMLIRPERASAATKVPNVALHAAVLTRGGPPELPGYL